MKPEVEGRARKVGGSLMVVIPKDVADSEGIRDGSSVKLRIVKKRVSSFGAFHGIGPWEGHEGDWGHE